MPSRSYCGVGEANKSRDCPGAAGELRGVAQSGQSSRFGSEMPLVRIQAPRPFLAASGGIECESALGGFDSPRFSQTDFCLVARTVSIPAMALTRC